MGLRLICLLAPWLLGGCTSFFFAPDRIDRQAPGDLGLRYDDVWLYAQDRTRLHAWYLPAVGERRGTILYLHGNAKNMSAFLGYVRWLPASGLDVLMLDPRGYGRSGGAPSLDGVHQDVQAALAYLAVRACGEIIVFGQSLGGAIGLHAVAHSPHAGCVRGVVTEGAFSSYRRIAIDKLPANALTRPLATLIGDGFSPERAAASLGPIPLLIVHGEADLIVPPYHAHRLAAAAGAGHQLWLLPGVVHSDAVLDPAHRARLTGWMAEALRGEMALCAAC